AREHEAVDAERVLARFEQLREAHLAGAIGLLEEVVLGHDAAARQRSPLRRDPLDRTAKLHLRLEQLVARASVLVRLAREADVVTAGQAAQPNRRAPSERYPSAM